MSKERDILKSLLLKEELDKLDKLEKKLLSKEQFTQEVSEVLAGAIKRSQKKDKSIERALSKPINAGITKAFSTNKQSIIDSLLPIMGQLIRKTVTNSIKQFVTDVNRALELNLSFKSIKWRLQASKAGISYAEMVFQKTISYKVQELFVINRESGLLIHHVGENATMLDNNAISAMLTVIQDFIAESVKTDDSGLSSATIGEAAYIIAPGPKAYLAAIVTGATSERYKQKSQELIENIHAEFSALLTDETRYQNDEEFEEYLSSHLISKSITPEKKKTNWMPWFIISLIIIFGVLYWSNSRYQERQRIIKLAQSTPGFFFQSIEKNKDYYIVTGLIDPIADNSAILSKNVKLNTQPFISLDPQIIRKRVELIAKKYNGLSVNITDQNATISGNLNSKDAKELLEQLENVIGINNIINNISINDYETIIMFIKNHSEINKNISYKFDKNVLYFDGVISQNKYRNFLNQFTNQFPNISIDDKMVIFKEDIPTLIDKINLVTINIPRMQNEDTIEKNKLINVSNTIIHLSPYLKNKQVFIIGESDCYGEKSDDYSLQRAKFIYNELIKNKVNEKVLKTQIKPCERHNLPENDNMKIVSFKIS